MKINHSPIFDEKAAVKLYSKKDGVDVTYICTSALNEHAAVAGDIFYRETPHPEYGNRYFALYQQPFDGKIMISNADNIETLKFNMFYSKAHDMWYYSQHRHDFRLVPGAGINIDGGRSYTKIIGDIRGDYQSKIMIVKDGEFIDGN